MSLDSSQLAVIILLPLLIILNIILFFLHILNPNLLTLELFAILFIIFVSAAVSYRSRYTSEAKSISTLLSIRNQSLGVSIDTLTPNTTSVAKSFLQKTAPYNHETILNTNITLLNWAPLTVRLAGYLGGDTSVKDGVFDMANGVKYALELGARSFVFNIDFLDIAPCQPLLIHRDTAGFQRSLNTGSIKDGMQALNDKAFSYNNYDPVIIVLYLHRIPSGKTQRSSFFNAIATAMNPISPHHLGLTEDGNFHNCGSESSLFTGEITSYQRKFIVLCNYDTTILDKMPNPKDNLNFWVNARLWQHENSTTKVGSVTMNAPSGTIMHAKVGSPSDFLSLSGDMLTNFPSNNRNIYIIALGPVEQTLTMGTGNQLDTLITARGIQSVPMDVIRLGEHPNHIETVKNKVSTPSFDQITNPSSTKDQLSYWTYAGYYRFKHTT
jgi:hypothetical protein